MKEVVFITGPWCNTCHAMKPKVEKMCNSKKVSMKVLDMVDNESEIVPYAPTALPTIVVMENNQECARFAGATDVYSIEKML